MPMKQIFKLMLVTAFSIQIINASEFSCASSNIVADAIDTSSLTVGMRDKKIHVIALENGQLIPKTPFAGRIGLNEFTHIDESKDDENDDFSIIHGGMVASLLVGNGAPRLPENYQLSVIEDFHKLHACLDTVTSHPDDLLLINFSAIHGSVETPAELKLELKVLRDYLVSAFLDHDQALETFKAAITLRIQQVDMVIQATENTPATSSGVTWDFLRNVRDILQTAYDVTHTDNASTELPFTHPQCDSWVTGITDYFAEAKDTLDKIYAAKFKDQMDEMQRLIERHPNFLLFWAIGNDGQSIDKSLSHLHILANQSLLARTILVQGVRSTGHLHIQSNYTHTFATHIASAPFVTSVWDASKQRKAVAGGTSFAAPRVVVEAFNVAKSIITHTGETPHFSVVKGAIVGKTFL